MDGKRRGFFGSTSIFNETLEPAILKIPWINEWIYSYMYNTKNNPSESQKIFDFQKIFRNLWIFDLMWYLLTAIFLYKSFLVGFSGSSIQQWPSNSSIAVQNSWYWSVSLQNFLNNSESELLPYDILNYQLIQKKMFLQKKKNYTWFQGEFPGNSTSTSETLLVSFTMRMCCLFIWSVVLNWISVKFSFTDSRFSQPILLISFKIWE